VIHIKEELMKVLSLVYFIDERKSLRHAPCSEPKCFIYKVKLMKVLSLVYFIDESKSLRHALCSVSSGVSYTR
jgi:hypothetical protein